MSSSHNRITAAILIILLTFGAGISAAHAQPFGDCTDASYRASFDPRIEDTPYDCVERLRIDYTCSGSSLETTLTFPGIPTPMVTQYTKISGPGE